MKRAYDTLILFAIETEFRTFEMAFASDWRFTEMFEFMVDRYEIDCDKIVEIRNTFVKRYKVTKDD